MCTLIICSSKTIFIRRYLTFHTHLFLVMSQFEKAQKKVGADLMQNLFALLM